MSNDQQWGKAKVDGAEILSFARRMASRAQRLGIDPDDAESDIVFGLLIAAQRYEPEDYVRVRGQVAKNAIRSLGRKYRTRRREISIEEVDDANQYA